LAADNEGLGHLLHLQPLEPVLANLTTFTFLCGWDVTMILEVLQLCVNVEVLTLDFKNSPIRCRQTPFPPSHMFHYGVLLPNVRILRLRHMQDAVHVIQIFKTPVLVELDISFANYGEDAISFIAPETLPQDFAPFVIRTRSNEKLRKF
jgi:hypothetical protein